MSEPPPPKRGGTFLYCPWTQVQVVDGETRWACGWERSGWTGSRSRAKSKEVAHA